MSIRTNTWDLKGHYDLTKSGQNPFLIINSLFSWAPNGSGELGLNDTISRSSPVQIPGTTWSSIGSGNGFSFATKTDGTLWSWGNNGSGRLGQNSNTPYSSPIQIPGTTWSSISGGRTHSLATKTDGTLWAWGLNSHGQLGQNNRIYYSSPIQIPGTTWSSVSGGYAHTLATKTGGTLWGWGGNTEGQLGQNSVSASPFAGVSSPVQIPGNTWSSIACGGSGTGSGSSFATKTDGTLWSWGGNYNGILGQNNRTLRSSPVQIPGTTWSSVSASTQHSLSTKTDGTLWSWGQNQFGQLGQGNRTYRSSPVQIPGTTWSSISGGTQYSLATKTDGTLWSWGYNGAGSNQGKLGQNNGISCSSPVQVPGTSWRSVRAGITHSLATQLVQ